MKPIKELKELTLLDRFLFDETVEDPEAMKIILDIILGEDVVLKNLPQTEKEQQRSRLYNSMIDSKLLEPGSISFNDLNDVFIIIISPFDLFGKGLYKYTFKMKCEEFSDVELGDGATRIFLNTRGINKSGVSDELVALLKYFEKGILETKKGSSEKVQELHNKINKINLSEEIGVRYMNLWEEKAFDRHDGYVEGHAKGVEEGIEKGMIQTRIEIARNFKAAGIPIEVIAGNTGLTIEEIEAL